MNKFVILNYNKDNSGGCLMKEKSQASLSYFMRHYRKPLIWIFIFGMLPSIYIFVYITGGIKYVFSHTMYVPILLAG